MKYPLLAALAAAIFILPTNTTHAAEPVHVVISQLQITGGPGKTTSDFIELYNPGTEHFDLKGYRLVKRTKAATSDTLIKSFTDSVYIPAGGYFLWANSGYSDIPVAPDATTSGVISDDNGVALRFGANDTGVIIDSVSWGQAQNGFEESAPFPENPRSPMSLMRTSNSDTDDNSLDFSITPSVPRNALSSVVIPIEKPEGGEALEEEDPIEEEEPLQNTGGQNLDYNNHDLLVTELLPNPAGRDSGSEWVEIYNAGTNSIDVSGWFFDDEGEGIGSSAYEIPEGTMLYPQKYKQFILPAGSFALNNTNGDCLRLLSPDELAQLMVCYEETAAEGSSYARNMHGYYEWSSDPTPGTANIFLSTAENNSKQQDVRIFISELLPNPADDEDEEFIEIYNDGAEDMDLAGWQIADEKRSYSISTEDFYDTSLLSKGFFVIPRTVSKIALNNSGLESVRLKSPDGQLLDEVSYEQRVKEEYAYARNFYGVFSWTSSPTPGKENVFDEDIGEDDVVGEPDEERGEVSGAEITSVSSSELRSLPLGTKVMVEAVVSVPAGLLGKDVFYIKGSGIRVHLLNSESLGLSVGDTVQVSGTLKNYRGELMLEGGGDVPLILVDSGQQVEPVTIVTGDAGEQYEGFLVRVAGQVVSTSGDIFYIDDGTGQVRIYIMDSTGIDKPRMRTGDHASVVGIMSQYDEAYRILPRFTSDIEVGDISASKSLPRTGSGAALAALSLIFSTLLFLELLWNFQAIDRRAR